MDLRSVCGQRYQSSRSRYCMKFGVLRQIPTLGRVSNLPSVWTNCLAAWMVNALGIGCSFSHAEKVRFFLSSRQCIVVPACRSVFLLHGWMYRTMQWIRFSIINIIPTAPFHPQRFLFRKLGYLV